MCIARNSLAIDVSLIKTLRFADGLLFRKNNREFFKIIHFILAYIFVAVESNHFLE